MEIWAEKCVEKVYSVQCTLYSVQCTVKQCSQFAEEAPVVLTLGSGTFCQAPTVPHPSRGEQPVRFVMAATSGQQPIRNQIGRIFL